MFKRLFSGGGRRERTWQVVSCEEAGSYEYLWTRLLVSVVIYWERGLGLPIYKSNFPLYTHIPLWVWGIRMPFCFLISHYFSFLLYIYLLPVNYVALVKGIVLFFFLFFVRSLFQRSSWFSLYFVFSWKSTEFGKRRNKVLWLLYTIRDVLTKHFLFILFRFTVY